MNDTDKVAAAETDELVLYSLPGHLVRRLQQVAVALFHDEMAPIGVDLTPVQYAALVGIQAYPGIDQASLAGVIAYDRTTIGGVIDRLEAKGLVKRKISAKDRRIRQLALEPAGADQLAAIRASVENVQNRLIAPLDPDERRVFMTLLRKLVVANNDSSRAPMRPFEGASPAP